MTGLTTLHTAGDGYWSEKSRAVRIVKLKLGYVSDDEDFGELRVYFDKNDWDVDNDGLIYTDSLFAKELREWLTSIGYDANKNTVFYSEQGMQGDYYVSLDVEGPFIKSWYALNETKELA